MNTTNIIKRLMVATYLLVAPLLLFAQNRIAYAYDAAGNRVSRTIVLPTRSASQSTEKSNYYQDMVADKRMKIYPNPTKGQLKVEILGLNDDNQCSLAVYTMNGVQVFKTITKSEITLIDLTNVANGYYLMKATVNGKATSWKIIKE